jgi:hypothetical protein
MHDPHKLTPRALLVLALCALGLLAQGGVARAAGPEGFGELTRFGLGGPGETPGILNDEHRTRILGVDPTDNSAYVLDEPTEQEQEYVEEPGCVPEPEEPEECLIAVGPITRHFRLQKFAASGGKYSAAATASFTEQAPGPSEKELPLALRFEEEVLAGWTLAVEGIAVDPGLKRVYVLAADYREPGLALDNSSLPSGSEQSKALLVASRLYAFSTQQAGSALVPAVGANAELAGPAALLAQSPQKGRALLEPAGLTVDPATHEVIILGHIDETGEQHDNVTNAQDHFALQRVHPDGTLGARWVDSKNFFTKDAGRELRPHSPIVNAGHVYVGYQEGLVQVPYNFESAEAPSPFVSRLAAFPGSIFEALIATPLQPGAPQGNEGPVRAPLTGGALSVAPEGTIFGSSLIHLEEEGAYQAVLELGAEGSIVGWTGGQVQHPENKEPFPCVIEPLFYGPFAPVAAGSGGVVFALAPAFLFDRAISGEELQRYGPTKVPAVIEFGPGGKGCPAAKSREGLIAKVKGEPLGEKTANTGEPLTFSTALRQADSLKVDWDFGDGSQETVSANQGLHPEARHVYAHGGKVTVTATIHTDDLATPTITLTTHVAIGEAASSAPKALANGPLAAYKGEPALFDGSASSDPNGPNQIAEYHWVFGDGQQASSTEPTVWHTYASLGSYPASLTVTNKHGLTSTPYALPHPVSVTEHPPASAEAPPSPRQGYVPAPGAGGGVAAYAHVASGLAPIVTLASAALRASAAGTLSVVLYCPAGEISCAGTVTLRGFVTSKDKHRRTHRSSVTLASGAFTMSGGTQRTVVLHISRQARSLLARLRTLQAQAIVAAHDPSGATHTTQLGVTVQATKSGAKHRKR